MGRDGFGWAVGVLRLEEVCSFSLGIATIIIGFSGLWFVFLSGCIQREQGLDVRVMKIFTTFLERRMLLRWQEKHNLWVDHSDGEEGRDNCFRLEI